MRKYLPVLLVSGMLFGVLSLSLINKQSPQNGTAKTPVESLSPQKEIRVNLVLDFGQGEKKEATTEATTVFEALKSVTDQNNLKLKTKQYDFGVFVEAIGEMENTGEKAWIYSVNGKAGEVAADKYGLREGDIVEWKYIKPTY